jgi:hypothetical protein
MYIKPVPNKLWFEKKEIFLTSLFGILNYLLPLWTKQIQSPSGSLGFGFSRLLSPRSFIEGTATDTRSYRPEFVMRRKTG